jgi:hypothetical protein
MKPICFMIMPYGKKAQADAGDSFRLFGEAGFSPVTARPTTILAR